MLVVVVILVTFMATWKFYYDILTINSRDSKRITDLKTIEIALSAFKTYKKVYPKPNSYAKIENSWNLLYQWDFWKDLKKTIKLMRMPKDPLDKSFYTYAINKQKTEYQLLSFFEGDTPSLDFTQKTQASYFSLITRTPHTQWFPIGIILDENNLPLNRKMKSLNLSSDSTNTYKIIYKDYLIWKWKWGNFIFDKYEYRSCNDIKIAWIWTRNWLYSIVPDWKKSVKVYCDMTTAWWGWTLASRIYSDREYLTTNAVWNLTSPYQKSTAKLSDELINKISSTNRFLVKVWKNEENKFFLRNKNLDNNSKHWISTISQPEMQFSCLNSPNEWNRTYFWENSNKNYIKSNDCSFTAPTDITWTPIYHRAWDNVVSAYMYSDARDERSCWLNHCKTAWSKLVVPGSIWVK